MNTLIKQMELTFWNIAIPLLTRSQVVRAVIQKSIGFYQEKKIVYQAAVVTVIACAGFAAGLLAYSVSLFFS
jgi:hypothetical protein